MATLDESCDRRDDEQDTDTFVRRVWLSIEELLCFRLLVLRTNRISKAHAVLPCHDATFEAVLAPEKSSTMLETIIDSLTFSSCFSESGIDQLHIRIPRISMHCRCAGLRAYATQATARDPRLLLFQRATHDCSHTTASIQKRKCSHIHQFRNR